MGAGTSTARGGGPAPDPVPVTTIAWRLGHLGGIAVGGFANRRFGDGTLTAAQIGFPSCAAAVPGFLDGHYRTWRAGLTSLSPSEWSAPLGPAWGPLRRGQHRRPGPARPRRGHPPRRRGRPAQRPLLPPLLAPRLRRGVTRDQDAKGSTCRDRDPQALPSVCTASHSGRNAWHAISAVLV